MSSEDAERISELQDRMKKIMNDPVVKELGDMLAYTPIWGMTGGALTYFLTDWAYKTNRIAPKSPRFVKFGATLMGAMGGFQLGLWKIRNDFKKIDPQGEKAAEMRRIVAEMRDLQKFRKPNGLIPRDDNKAHEITSSKAQDRVHMPRTNQYGDVIEDDVEEIK